MEQLPAQETGRNVDQVLIPTPQKKHPLRMIVFVIILVLVVAACIIWMFKLDSNKHNLTNNNIESSIAKKVRPIQPPSNFPSDLPADPSSDVLVDNYQGPYVFGSKQDQQYKADDIYIKTYYSNKSLNENFTDFKNYFQRNNWQVNTVIDEPNEPLNKSLSAKLNNLSIVINLSQVSTTKTQINILFGLTQ